jgi:hypothetical protein
MRCGCSFHCWTARQAAAHSRRRCGHPSMAPAHQATVQRRRPTTCPTSTTGDAAYVATVCCWLRHQHDQAPSNTRCSNGRCSHEMHTCVRQVCFATGDSKARQLQRSVQHPGVVMCSDLPAPDEQPQRWPCWVSNDRCEAHNLVCVLRHSISKCSHLVSAVIQHPPSQVARATDRGAGCTWTQHILICTCNPLELRSALFASRPRC